MGFNISNEHIAVHIRHGDARREKHHGDIPAGKYADAIREASQNLSVLYFVYVASDDDSVGEELKALLSKDAARYKVYFRFSPNSKKKIPHRRVRFSFTPSRF